MIPVAISYFAFYPLIAVGEPVLVSPTITIELFNHTANETHTWTTQETTLVISTPFVSESEMLAESSQEMSITCTATYPVALRYDGVGDFHFLSGGKGSSDCGGGKDGELCIPKYWATEHFPSVRSSHTGKYICGASNTTRVTGKSANNLTSSFTLYVEGKKPFVRQRGGNIFFDNDAKVILPCLPSNPNTTIKLAKVDKNGGEIAELDESKYFDEPEVGIKFRSAEESFEAGIYLCLAEARNESYFTEYSVKKIDKHCTTSCEELGTICKKHLNGRETCECDIGFENAITEHIIGLVEQSCVRKCSEDKDCPDNMACEANEKGFKRCVNPCYSAPCIKKECKVENRKPLCKIMHL